MTSTLKLFCVLVLNDRNLTLEGHEVLNMAVQIGPKENKEAMSEEDMTVIFFQLLNQT